MLDNQCLEHSVRQKVVGLMECMNDALSTSINSDLPGDLIPAEM